MGRRKLTNRWVIDVAETKTRKSFSETLNLPKTDFPMKANLPAREPEIEALWEDKDLYGEIRRARAGAPKFILHDGPPYANAPIHLGQALNKTLKDITVKFQTMTGHDAPYVPGWDCHGLPIELRVLTTTGLKRHEIDPVELRKRCREFALRYVDLQREQFKRLGVCGDWENPYLTLAPEYEARQIRVFGEMMKKGYLYRGLKPVYWCPDCETALAEAEVEYADTTSPSIFVSFPVVDTKGKVPPDIEFLAWTTTPWTLPANVAVSLHPEEFYRAVRTQRGVFLAAEKRLKAVLESLNLKGEVLTERWKGADLEGVVLGHPLFDDRTSLAIVGRHVSMDEGTGLVHTAPGHGEEDFEAAKPYGLPVVMPIDERGFFTTEAGKFAGLRYDEAEEPILTELESRGRLWGRGRIVHSYPHCWRCKGEIIYRATTQWFASISGIKEQMLREIGRVCWIPEATRERISGTVRERPDWCISRQRVWGVPLPVFYCEECGEPLISEESINRVAELFEREGSDAWFSRSAGEILPPEASCKSCGSRKFRKETDTMDVWFDSGSSHYAVLDSREELAWPADLYLEGSDQHRGWFQSSLITGMAIRGSAPYRAVLTHGFVVDGEGRKMSKSLGNVIDPEEVMKKYGADILRLWAASSDFTGDVRVSELIIDQMAEVYRKIRNTIRFILGNLRDFDPALHLSSEVRYREIDRWALGELNELIRRVSRHYQTYQYHLLYHEIHNFCVITMSSLYLDVIKDRLYCEKPDHPERRAAQAALWKIGRALLGLVAPVLVHTADEAWQYFPRAEGDPWSVHLSRWPEPDEAFDDPALMEKWERLLKVRSVITKALEMARERKLAGASLETEVVLQALDKDVWHLLRDSIEILPELFIVSAVSVAPGPETGEPAESGVSSALVETRSQGPDKGEALHLVDLEGAGVKVSVFRAQGQKCARCWAYSVQARKDDEASLCPRCYRTLEELRT